MTRADEPHDDGIHGALARAFLGLSELVPSHRIFFEDRRDLRARFGSTCTREVVSTRQRGAAIDAASSLHVTEPDLGSIRDLVTAAARGEPAPSRTLVGPIGSAVRSEASDPLMKWVDAIEGWGSKNAVTAGRGLPRLHWDLRLAAFHQKIWVGAPDGRVMRDRRSGVRATLRLWREARSGSVSGDFTFKERPGSDADASFERLVDRLGVLGDRPGSPAAPGETAAVFAAGVGGILVHELIGHPAEGDTLLRGGSWLTDVASKVGPPGLAVVDDPRRGRGGWRFDDEGSPAAAVEIVRAGRLVSGLHDRASALASGVQPTGHGRRATYLDSVKPRMGCTFITQGSDDPDEILSSTRRGIFIHRLGGATVSPRRGRGRFIVSDSDRIVDGRRAEPLRPFVMEVDARKCLPLMDCIGRDLAFDTCIGSCIRDGQPLAVSVGAPTIRLGLIMVVS